MLMEKNPNDLNGLISALRGLSACKFEARNIRGRLVGMANSLMTADEQSNKSVHAQALVDGLVGLSQCNFKPEGTPELVTSLSKIAAERI